MLEAALSALREKADPNYREKLGRYGIVAPTALGVAMGEIQAIGKRLGRDHELAALLWETGIYEARLLAAYVDDPKLVSAAQMDRWARDFDNWALCDTLCFALFDRTAHAWSKPAKWAASKQEFVKRAAFALLASLAGHDKKATDRQFFDAMPLIEAGASDPRDLVKKGVSWALRRIGGRSLALNRAAVELAGRLADSDDAAARWVGKDALRDFARPAAQKRLSKAT